jgi:outer membrane lipoprotein SlyB
METQVNKMDSQSGKFPHAIIWIAGVALTVVCAAGTAALMGWIPNSAGGPADRTPIERQSANDATPAAPKPHATAATNHPAQVAHPAPARVAVASTCADCGVIESVREIDTKGSGSGVGGVGGAVVGGLLGNQVGGGRGKDVMTVVGAVGGAFAGNEIEKRVKSTKSYEITVRLQDGSSRAISSATLPTWRTGDKVKLVNGAIESNT